MAFDLLGINSIFFGFNFIFLVGFQFHIDHHACPLHLFQGNDKSWMQLDTPDEMPGLDGTLDAETPSEVDGENHDTAEVDGHMRACKLEGLKVEEHDVLAEKALL